jgi:RHH-type transcriptional regulator, rel operon repressor / antitoxin RelB
METSMLAVRLPENLEQRLSELSEQTHRSKSFYVKQALSSFLDDHEDRLIAISRLEENNPRISLEEMERRLGLED